MRLLAVLISFLAFAVPAGAVDFSNPRAVIETLFGPYLKPFDHVDWSSVDEAALRSDGLTALFDRDREEANGEVGRLDFDPYVNAQDYEITELEISEPYFAGGKAVVGVSFKNLGTPQDMGYLLVEERGGRRIDDMWAAGIDFSYGLRDILEAPMP